MRLFLLTALMLVSLFPSTVLAQDDTKPSFSQRIWTQLNKTARPSFATSDNAEKTLQTTLANSISIFMGILGTAAVILVIYAGFLWTTAGGNDEQVARAKTILKQVVIGFVVVVLAYAVVSFVFSVVLQLPASPPTPR